MTEFEVGGQTYRSGKMNARTQFHVLRRAAPIVGPIKSLTGGGVLDRPGTGEAFVALANAIATLSDEDSDYILDQCLAVVERKQGETAWARVKVSEGSAMMFDDIDMMVMLRITSHVMRDNFSALFQGGLAALSGEAKA